MAFVGTMFSHSRTVFHPIGLHLELLMLTHHLDEPLVCLMACGEAVGGREPERHLGRRQVRVGVDAADGEVWIAYKWSGTEAALVYGSGLRTDPPSPGEDHATR